MNTKLLLTAVVVIGAGVGAVVVAGDLLPGGNDATESEAFPTATPSDAETPSDGGDDVETTTADSSIRNVELTSSAADGTSTETPPFGFAIDSIEECGQTCRDVTSTLTNQQDTTAENITVSTWIFAGQGTDGDEIWRGQEDAGTLAAGESYTATNRVELSLSEGLKIQNNDGWITVQTTVETEDQTVTFTDERQVA
jgi:hypothetical protein